ncbi:MAG: hypothetical protein KGP28_10320 [Bdellovibrionales bacterium]|nr:hypothetical protein [Bdellovibrionales bacterium]
MLISMMFGLSAAIAAPLDSENTRAIEKAVNAVQSVNSKSACPVPETAFDQWASLPECSVNGTAPKVFIKKYPKNHEFSVIPLNGEVQGAIATAFQNRNTDPALSGAVYLGNGPIYGPGGSPKGYLKSGGKVISKISCSPDPKDGNWGRENAVFVSYRPRNAPLKKHFRVISTRTLCIQCGLLGPESEKKWESDGEDLIQCDQIDFAIQSGPAILLENELKVPDFKSTAAETRSLIGVAKDGSPVTVDVDGNLSLSCLAVAMKDSGITQLLHRDSTVVDVAIQGKSGKWNEHYPSQRSGSKLAASVLVIKPGR